jgi:hypothetical protein
LGNCSESVFDTIMYSFMIWTDHIDLMAMLTEFFINKIVPITDIKKFLRLIDQIFYSKHPGMAHIIRFKFENPDHYQITYDHVIKLYENSRALNESDIQTYFDICGQSSKQYTKIYHQSGRKNYKTLGSMCNRNIDFMHVFYAYSDMDELTFAILDDCQRWYCRYILPHLPDNWVHTDAVYNSFVKILSASFVDNIDDLLDVIIMAHKRKTTSHQNNILKYTIIENEKSVRENLRSIIINKFMYSQELRLIPRILQANHLLNLEFTVEEINYMGTKYLKQNIDFYLSGKNVDLCKSNIRKIIAYVSENNLVLDKGIVRHLKMCGIGNNKSL